VEKYDGQKEKGNRVKKRKKNYLKKKKKPNVTTDSRMCGQKPNK